MADLENTKASSSEAVRETGKSVIFMSAKNEGVFIPEWVAYHRAIGFDKIIIASNNNTDGSEVLLDNLARNGFIDRHIKHQPTGEIGPQYSALKKLLDDGEVDDGDWFIFLDADEFLNIHVGDGTVNDLVDHMGDSRVLQLYWRIFGSNDNNDLIPRFVSEAFEKCSAPFDKDFKGRKFHQLARFQSKPFYRFAKGELEPHTLTTHVPRIFSPVADFKVISASSSEVDYQYFQQRAYIDPNNPKPPSVNSKANEISWNIAQINHYAVRNHLHFSYKEKRGRGHVNTQLSARKNRHDESYYAKYDINEATDSSILRHKTATQASIDRMLNIPMIKNSYDAVLKSSLSDSETTVSNVGQNLPSADSYAIDAARPETNPSEPWLPDISMPDLAIEMLTRHYEKAKTILEFGSGGSTVMAARLGEKTVFSVESDIGWAERLMASIQSAFPKNEVTIRHVDIGPTGQWGRPKRPAKWANWSSYPLAIWDEIGDAHPDVILIDGRFRVGCFYGALFSIRKPTTILFDDYVNRSTYHEVEKYVKPVEFADRMAKFEIRPSTIDKGDLLKIVRSFYSPE